MLKVGMEILINENVEFWKLQDMNELGITVSYGKDVQARKSLSSSTRFFYPWTALARIGWNENG